VKRLAIPQDDPHIVVTVGGAWSRGSSVILRHGHEVQAETRRGYDRSMQETPSTAPENIETKRSATAHHEAGHMVIAAVVGLAMRPAGFAIDRVGEGVACYCFIPEDNDESRERVLLATFAGWYAQQRFCDLVGLVCPAFAHPGLSCDWWQAADILPKLAGGLATKDKFEQGSRVLVQQHWPVIEFLAADLLTREWEPVKDFASGWTWAKATEARYITGEEVVSLLAGRGIQTHVDSECLGAVVAA
jgi:hypothetical protein